MEFENGGPPSRLHFGSAASTAMHYHILDRHDPAMQARPALEQKRATYFKLVVYSD
jgi:hypothetical protein